MGLVLLKGTQTCGKIGNYTQGSELLFKKFLRSEVWQPQPIMKGPQGKSGAAIRSVERALNTPPVSYFTY